MRRWSQFSHTYLRSHQRRFTSTGLRAFPLTYAASISKRLTPTTPQYCIKAEAKPRGEIYNNISSFSTLQNKNEETIYALSTAPGRAAIAVIRISGPSALKVYHGLCPTKPTTPKPRHATLRTLYNPTSSTDEDAGEKTLDSGALVFYFPAPETATGEDILELHVHGGTAVVKAVLAAIPNSLEASEGRPPAIRYAEPGEFTRRAFYNNRLDLVQIEALANTLSAETEQQRRLAVRSSRGSLADRYETWRQKLLLARGELEALIDFSEDQHFDESPAELCISVARQVEELAVQLKENIKSAARGELLRNGINIALVGAPNAGKSSLFNCIVGREAAIVSEEAGTTRDVVEASVDIGGYLCRFGDLAGLREVGKEPKLSKGPEKSEASSISAIEKEGMKRARERALIADLVIVICSRFRRDENRWVAEVEPEISELLQQLNPKKQKVIFVLNKIDLFSISRDTWDEICHDLTLHRSLKSFLEASDNPPSIYPLSCKAAQKTAPTTNDPDPGGIQTLLNGLTQHFKSMTSALTPENENSNATWAAESLGATERQRVLLEQCLLHLSRFLVEVNPKESRSKNAEKEGQEEGEIDIVLAAESLRSAGDCLARITGRGEAGDVEEVLGVVFEKFCVGK